MERGNAETARVETERNLRSGAVPEKETRIEKRRRIEREQELALDEALAEWLRTPDAAATARLRKAAAEYLGVE